MDRFVLAGLLGLAVIGAVAGLVSARQPASDEGAEAAFVLPERTSPSPPEAVVVPSVPASAESLSPVSFTLTTTWDGMPGRRVVEQRVTRARDRAHLIVDGGRREWYFARNPVHPDRVSAWLVDHDTREILAHEESSLRSALRLRGWVDVVTMRFDVSLLEAMAETGERRWAADHAVHRFRAASPAETGVVEVWWSPSLFLPIELVTRESATVTATARVLNLSAAIDESLLASPERRFPAYRVVDSVDAGEHR